MPVFPGELALVHLAVSARTDTGRLRKGNEDNLYADANEYRGLFIVADGMGGHAAGEVASQMAVDLIARELAEVNNLASPEAGTRLSDTLRLANRQVFQRTMSEVEKTGMGSTASALLLSDTRYLIGHVGDSRIYLVRDGMMQQLTRDHSLVQEQVDAGLITAEQARHHPQSNVITCCIGMSSEIEPDVIAGETHVGDVFLLASDGLTGMVEDRRLQQLLQSRAAPERIVNAMIADANNNGGIDNITAIVVKVVTADTRFTTGEVTPIPQGRSYG
ncbi:MAG: Stp1/IreP family PP2C-type Ser/Thr phosphatase [Gemmatimonadota bacterium]|nr:Stp1/IreP family PP2C-type Ser/Thr phosphatase [Gemmatimonadota bacterium]